MSRFLAVLLLLVTTLSHNAASAYLQHAHHTTAGIAIENHRHVQPAALGDRALVVDEQDETHVPTPHHAHVPVHGMPNADFVLVEPVIERQRQPLPDDAPLHSYAMAPPVEPPSA